MGFITAQYSAKGGRMLNEDTIYVYQAEDIYFAVVADGLGMHGGGDIASKTAAHVLAGCFLENPDLDKKIISDFFNKANSAVLARQTSECKMKSTVAALFYHKGKMVYANLGDSRLYHFRKDRIVFQTIDHSVSQAAVFAGEIDVSGIRFHEDRNRVLRALGSQGEVRPDITALEGQAVSGDAFLLCTDGFWEYVLEQEMEIDLAKSETPDQWLSYLFTRIGKRIKGENDNLSVVASFYIDS